jgi:hypothetical protein
MNPINASLIQFKFTSNSMTSVAVAGLDTNANEGCTTAGYPTYDPTPDERYYVLGISSATAANNGEIIAGNSGSGGEQLKEFQFASSVLNTTPLAKNQFYSNNNPSPVSPLTEFYNSNGSQNVVTVTSVTATATVVTVTAANTLAAGDTVTIAGVTNRNYRNCSAADVTAINGTYAVIAAGLSTTVFEFNATIPNPTIGNGCNVNNATATYYTGADYMFVGTNHDQSAVYSFLLPAGAVSAVPTATNTTDAPGGTSAIIVDNDSISGQASSLYYGTLATSTGICGTTVYCAVKLTQSLLQ